MTALEVTPDMDQDPWVDVIDQLDPLQRDFWMNGDWDLTGVSPMAAVERVGLLRHGTSQGRATIALLIRLPDGRAVMAETTLRLARAAAMSILASPAFSEETLD